VQQQQAANGCGKPEKIYARLLCDRSTLHNSRADLKAVALKHSAPDFVLARDFAFFSCRSVLLEPGLRVNRKQMDASIEQGTSGTN
jgi:hypothetical protein